jgi:dTDP-4-dehydrorhamnose 3,5-epimerase
MNFKFIPDIKNLVVIEPDLYKDNRGENFEGYDTDKFLDIVKSSNSLSNKFKDKKFVLDTFSKSKQNVFRGLHGDNKTWKLISCLYGKIYLVVAQPLTKKWAEFYLDSKTRNQVLVPPDCVNGHYCISEECLFSYKMTEHYNGIDSQYTVKWHDKDYNFDWPFDLTKAIISNRDN